MTNKKGKGPSKYAPKDIPRKVGIKMKLKLKNWGVLSENQHRNFSDFSGFLANSIISPVIYTPFREQDKRCFATMENLTRHLTGISNNVHDLISVIMPVHNRIDTVTIAINSVLEQSYTNFELIIVDDGSDDGTKELIDNLDDPRIKTINNESCRGVSNARNHGLKASKGKYIAYLDSDNLWDSRYLAAMVGAFIMLDDADAVYGGQLLFKGNKKNPFAVRFGSFNRSLLNNRNYIDLNALCHTRELYNRIGGFDESLVRLVDYDLILRMSENAQIYSVPVLLSHYYYDRAPNTITNIPGYVEYLEIVRKKRSERLTKLNSRHHKLDHGVSVIIPSYEAIDDIKECIDSLHDHNNDDSMEIVVVDNSSGPDLINYLDEIEADGKIKLIKNQINYGFTYAVNQGIEISNPDNDIIIMNNDAIVTDSAIYNLQKAAYQLQDCGIIVPQQVLPADTKTINAHVPFAYSQYECDVNLSAAHENIVNVSTFHSGDVVELSFAPFFCAYIKRDVYDDSVGLDAEYGRHYRSDRIFCNYIRHIMNLKIFYVADAVVYHKLQRSTDLLRSKPKKGSSFDYMFKKNQWDPELAGKLGYKTPPWDF
jgi:O-antigen biosynthesis protein